MTPSFNNPLPWCSASTANFIDWENWWAGRSGLDTWCDDQNHMLLPHHIYSW